MSYTGAPTELNPPLAHGLEDRFYAKTRRDLDTGCLLWTGARRGTNRSDGVISVSGKLRTAIWVAYALRTDKDAGPGARFMPLCKSVGCVEVDHRKLLYSTPRYNAERPVTAKTCEVSHDELSCDRDPEHAGCHFDDRANAWFGEGGATPRIRALLDVDAGMQVFAASGGYIVVAAGQNNTRRVPLCKHGHELIQANRIGTRGQCRTCHEKRAAENHHKQHAGQRNAQYLLDALTAAQELEEVSA